MGKRAIYFFAAQPRDFAMCVGLADIIREVKPELPLHLIYTDEPNSVGYRWDALLDRYDSVRKVRRVVHGAWRGRFNLRGFVWVFTKGFAGARKARSEMRKLHFEPNSIAFVFGGYSLGTSIFLRRLQEDKGVSSVLIAEQVNDDATLSDFVLGYGESLYLNLFQRFFGTAYFDVFWMRTPGSRATAQREYRFRNNPADYTFLGEHSTRRLELRPTQTYWPSCVVENSRRTGSQSVIVFGQIFEWVPLVYLEAFYRRFNELLGLIRTKHEGQRLLYLAHPGQPDEQTREIQRLDLEGFEVVRNISSEAIIQEDSSIGVAYGVFSRAILTAASMGVRGHFLYNLFDDESIDDLLKRRLDGCFTSEIYPDMRLTSVERWMAGDTDYIPESSATRLRDAAVKMLEIVGVLDTGETRSAAPGVPLAQEERWVGPLAAWFPVGLIRSVIGIPPGYSIRRRIGGMLSAPVRFARKLVQGAQIGE